MTKGFKQFVRLYMRLANVKAIDALTESALAIQYVSALMSVEHVVMYGSTKELNPTAEQIVQEVRESCGEDVYKRMFEVIENEQ